MGQSNSPLEQLAVFGICILIGSALTVAVQKYGDWKQNQPKRAQS